SGQRRLELFGLKRLLQGGASPIRLRQTAFAVAGNKNEWQSAPGQNIGHGVDLLAVQINIQNSSAEFAALGDLARFRDCANGGSHSIAELVQQVLKQHAD